MEDIVKLRQEILELKRELELQSRIIKKVKSLELLIESLTKEIVIQKYQTMVLAKEIIGKNWKNFLEKLPDIPEDICKQVLAEHEDICWARQLINDIFKDQNQ